MSKPCPVVVTGVAAIGPHGDQPGDLLTALRQGAPLSRPLDQPEPSATTRRCHTAATCPELDLTPWVAPRAAHRMSQLSQWAVAAGRMTLENAGWGDASTDDLAICLSSVFGPSDFVNKLLIQILRESPMAASPFLFTDCVANAPSGQLAIAAGAHGANYTISQREAGPLMTMIQGTREVQSGRANAALVGSVDEVDSRQFAILARMRALALEGEPARPFDHHRSGILFGEGAGVVLLESAANAERRGAAALARVACMVRAFDPTATPAGWGSGHTNLGRALRRGLDEADIDPRSIDVVISGASGARAGDRLEALTLREAFDDALPPILAPKAVFGEYGVGGVLVPGVLALRGGSFASPLGFEVADPELAVTLAPCDLAAPRRALLTSLATGGAASWVVLETCS